MAPKSASFHCLATECCPNEELNDKSVVHKPKKISFNIMEIVKCQQKIYSTLGKDILINLTARE
jgi:hypothetical protein